ncbi:MAG: hypothetical protein OFPI_31090 [Osedax symbiont Rs2]|nr:MAG: hypothetical protein OFPI_31090 [Osedax symbiont Rs2]
MKITRLLKAIVITAAMAISQFSFAADIEANADDNDIAIKGYDPVAYFTQGKAMQGSHKYSATYKNAIYHFSNANNRDLFKANAEKFAPQYGGFCAMGVAMKLKFDTDPQAWRIVDQKLYLNLSKTVQKKWLSDIPGHIDTAENNWGELKGLTPAQAKANSL